MTRRDFVAASSAALFAGPALLRGQNLNSKVNLAVIGSGGRGGANAKAMETENITVVCDVNQANLDSSKTRYKQAKAFVDFRKVFDHVKDFDAVVVSTTEHTHAFVTLLALQAGKHVYCEKPLTHNIHEARLVRQAAEKNPKLVTQMGIQNHANPVYRTVVEIIRSGAIGPVRQVHVWVARAWGLQSKEAAERNKDRVYVTERPMDPMPVPPGLDWDLWIGPAPFRPYHEVYFPGPKWYRWWDFGNGTMSDLGSHFNDLPFWALGLQAPRSVQAFGPPAHPEIAPATMRAVYEYGPRGDQPPLTLTWHQGEDKPELLAAGKLPPGFDSGHLFIGDKGMLVSSYKQWKLLPEEKFVDFKLPPQTLPRPESHHAEWIECIKTGKQAMANFTYSGWLTEANHLGNVAYRAGKRLEWDTASMRAVNAPEADRFIRREYRKGWTLGA
jgi:hypothetical protein